MFITEFRYLILTNDEKQIIKQSLTGSEDVRFYKLVKDEEENECIIYYLISSNTTPKEIVCVVNQINEYVLKNPQSNICNYLTSIRFLRRKNGPENPVFSNFTNITDAESGYKKFEGFYALQLAGIDDSLQYENEIINEFTQIRSLRLVFDNGYDVLSILKKIPEIEYLHAHNLTKDQISELKKINPNIQIENVVE